jgi:transposase-like protein
MITASGSDNSCIASAAVLPKVPVTTDTQGRLRVSKAQRRDILAALARSGESLPQFARRTGLKYSTLARWVQCSRPKQSGRRPRLRLLEAVVESSPVTDPGTLLVLQLPGGVRVEVADEKQVALAAILVRELSKPC